MNYRPKPWIPCALIVGFSSLAYSQPDSDFNEVDNAKLEQQATLSANDASRRTQRSPSANCTTANTPIYLADASIARVAGFEFAEIEREDLGREVDRNAEIVYDANHYARISSRVPGVVSEVMKDLGEFVAQGEVIAIINSMALGSTKADLLQASEMHLLWKANAERERTLMEKGVSTERELLEAQTRLAEARIAVSRVTQQLRNLGLSDVDIDQIVENEDTGSSLHITAPFAGMMVERDAVIGEVVNASDLLFSIADTSKMWAMIDLVERDLALVRKGQQSEFRMRSFPEREFGGSVNWISSQLDKKTRTIKARIEIDNRDQLLKAFMFGRATIAAGGDSQAIAVPKSAVQWEGCCNIAFVKGDDEGLIFQPARLQLGIDTGEHYEVLSGLKVGDVVVTTGSFVLKNEILKDSVGKGCCEVDHLSK